MSSWRGSTSCPGTTLEGGPGRQPSASRPATRWRRGRSPLGEPVRKFDQIIGFASQPTSRRASTSTCTIAACASSPATTPSGQDVRPIAMVPEAERPLVRRLRARQRQGRHAQLYRHPVDGELLGLGLASSSPSASRPRCWRSTRTSTASSRSPTAPAAAWPTAARATPPCSGRCGASRRTRTSPRS